MTLEALGLGRYEIPPQPSRDGRDVTFRGRRPPTAPTAKRPSRIIANYEFSYHNTIKNPPHTHKQ